MMKNRRKLRAVGLLLAIGLVSGMFVQYQAPSAYFAAAPQVESTQGRQAAEALPVASIAPAREAENAAPLLAPPDSTPPVGAQGEAVVAAVQSLTQTVQAQADEAKAVNIQDEKVQPDTVQAVAQKAPETPVAKNDEDSLAPDEATPTVLRRYQAIAAVIGNTLEIAGRNGEKRYVYFAPRGVAADFVGDKVEARFWTRDDDHLCRSLGAQQRECFYLVIQLDEKLHAGSAKTLDERIERLDPGAALGAVEGFEDGKVRLLRGNIRKLPDYIPLLEDKPGPEWTRDPATEGRSFVGAILLRHSGDEDRAATFFAPNGQVFEVSRLTRQTVSLKIGAWRRQGDLVCRTLSPAEAGQRDASEECAHARLVDGRVEFAEAGPARRAYLRWPWADEETAPERASRVEASAQAAEVNLAPPTRARKLDNASQASFTDLR